MCIRDRLRAIVNDNLKILAPLIDVPFSEIDHSKRDKQQKGLKAKGNKLDQKEIKLINKLDPIQYQPQVNDLNNIEVVDEKIDSNEDSDGSNNQTKLDF